MVSICEAALSYLARGWSVIPIEPRGKRPLIGWKEYIEHAPDKTLINDWWGRWPTANIALVTGKVSSIVVVDLDCSRGGGSPRSIYDKWPTDLISQTGSGYHFFYEYPGVQVRNQVGEQGIDVRADGGYVVIPPSTHLNGNQYRFLKEGKPGPTPAWLTAPDTKDKIIPDNHWLTGLLAGCDKGNRNDSCARLAGYFARKGMAKDVAVLLVSQWNEKNKPPLPSSELHTTVNSVYRTEFSKSQHNAAPKTENNKDILFPVVDLGSYMSRYGAGTEVSWQVENWLPSQTIGFVISPPGSYKTWLTLDLAISVASGKPFLGEFVTRDSGPVLVIQQEDPRGEIADRLALIAMSRCKTETPVITGDEFEVDCPPQLPIYIHTERQLKFANESIVDALSRKIEELKPRLVIIDPLYSAGSTDDYMAKTAEQMFVLKNLRDKFKCSFLVVHHTKKRGSTEGNSTNREDLWGSQFLNAFMETGWQIRATDEKESITVLRHFKIKGSAPLVQLDFNIKTEQLPYSYSVSCEEISADSIKKKMDITGLLSNRGPLSIVDIAKELGLHRSSVSRRVGKLVKLGALKKELDGKFKLTDLPQF